MAPRSPRPTEDMDDKLMKTLNSTDFGAWRVRIWKEISDEAIGKGWVPEDEQTEDGVIDPCHERWRQLHARMVGPELKDVNLLGYWCLTICAGRDPLSLSVSGLSKRSRSLSSFRQRRQVGRCRLSVLPHIAPPF